MNYRKLGLSDVEVSAVTFGAWAIGGWMWGGQDEDDAIAAIRKGVEMGMTSIDTAAVYGFGRSEELVARALEPFKRDDVQILTKFGLRWNLDEGEFHFESKDFAGEPKTVYKNARPESIRYEIEQSLGRLKTDYVDLYQCHWRDHTTPVDEMMAELLRLQEEGKIRAIGVSNFTAEEIEQCLKAGPLASNQPPYSMINREIEDSVLPFCHEHHVGVVVYSPLQRGLLTGKITPDYTFNEGDHRANNAYFKAGNIHKVNDLLDKIKPIAETHHATFAQLAIAWALHQPGVTATLVGARNTDQVADNAKGAEISLSDDELAAINGYLDDLDLDL